MRTHDLVKWRKLEELHKKAPFAFIIAVGGPRTVLKQMFPLTPIVSDITDLSVPGRRIAEFVWGVVTAVRAEYKASDSAVPKA
jgi:hypothetical protein